MKVKNSNVEIFNNIIYTSYRPTNSLHLFLKDLIMSNEQYKVNVWFNGLVLIDKHSIQVHNKFFKSGQMDMVVNF